MPGTRLTFYLDETRQVKPKAYNTTAIGENLGDMRQYQVYIPLYWNDLAPGMHTISGYTPLGGKVFADFYVNIMPNDSFVPDNTVKWVNDRNPYIPPVTVTVPVEVTVPVTVTVTITPDQDQLNRTAYEQQKIVAAENDAKYWAWVYYCGEIGAGLVIVVIGLYLGIPYVRNVARRAKK
jgi:hypothetical protein